MIAAVTVYDQNRANAVGFQALCYVEDVGLQRFLAQRQRALACHVVRRVAHRTRWSDCDLWVELQGGLLGDKRGQDNIQIQAQVFVVLLGCADGNDGGF